MFCLRFFVIGLSPFLTLLSIYLPSFWVYFSPFFGLFSSLFSCYFEWAFCLPTQNAHKDTIKKANKQIFFMIFVFLILILLFFALILFFLILIPLFFYLHSSLFPVLQGYYPAFLPPAFPFLFSCRIPSCV